MGEVSPSAEPRSAYPLCGEPPATPPTAVIPAKAGTSFFSSKGAVLQNVMLTIADCHPEETQDRIVFS